MKKNQKKEETDQTKQQPKTLLSLKKEAREALEKRAQEMGVSKTALIEHALLTEQRYTPAVEAGIAEYQKQHKCTRDAAIQDMLARALFGGK